MEVISDADFEDLKQLAGQVWAGRNRQTIEAFLHCLGEEGLRVPEALALRWQDLDIDRDHLTVGRSIDRQGRIRTPRAGTRTISLFPGTKARLLDLPPHEPSFVFVDFADQPLGRSRFSYRWRPIAAAWEQSRPADHWIHERLRRDPHAHLSLHELRRRAAAWLVTPKPAGPGYSPPRRRLPSRRKAQPLRQTHSLRRGTTRRESGRGVIECSPAQARAPAGSSAVDDHRFGDAVEGGECSSP